VIHQVDYQHDNVIVFKVVNEKMEWSGCVRFTTKTAQIIKNLKVTAAPQ
jgi:hypothetical protein